ncbi:MAG: hypothetical protein KAI76_07085 [Alphaproteobacteria bacterium]|nr:hypothetical protein [Alphaproteobacteria bacterium]
MADIPSIPSFPPVAVVSGNAPVTPVAPVAASQFIFTEMPVRQIPPELVKPEISVIVEGRVLSSNPKMQEIRIQTKMGEVVVQSSANLPPDTEVSVRVYIDKNQTLADISVLRQTVVASMQSEKSVPSPQPEKSVPSPPLLEGQIVTAFLLPEEPTLQIGTQKHFNSLLRNQELSFRKSVTTEEFPLFQRDTSRARLIQEDNKSFIKSAIIQKMSSSPHDTFRQHPPAYLKQETVFSPQSPDFRLPSSDFRIHILKIFPPDVPQEKINIALQKTEVPAPVIAKVEMATSNGSPILKTADSHFVIKTPVSVQVGSVVIFEARIVTPETRIQDISSFSPSGLPFSVHGDVWPALREALQILAPSTSPVAQAFRNTLPTPTPNLVPTALFFLAALRLGSVDSWLGDNTLKSLKQSGKKELAERLGSDFGKLSSLSKETLADGWRSISMPLLYDDQLSQMQFYVRHQYDNKDGDKEDVAKPATRFILNLHLSRMGEMQLDGFVRKKDFDVILRTEEKLPFDMRQELMKCFSQGLDQVRMQGKISFQTRQQSWITVNLPQQAGVVL